MKSRFSFTTRLVPEQWLALSAILVLLPVLVLAQTSASPARTLRFKIEADASGQKLLLDKLKQHGRERGVECELSDDNFDYRIAFDVSYVALPPGAIGASATGSYAWAKVYDTNGIILFGIERNSRVLWGDTDARATDKVANEIIKRLLKGSSATPSKSAGLPAVVVSKDKKVEDLDFSIEPGWSKANSANGPNHSYVVEYVREGDDINNWKELVTVERFRKSKSDSSPEQMLKNMQARRDKECPDSTLWNIIDKNEKSILYEWQAKPCLGFPEQHEIARIIFGEHFLFVLHYAAKVSGLPEETRSRWIKRFSAATVLSTSIGTAPDLHGLVVAAPGHPLVV